MADYNRSIQSSMWVMIVAQTIGSVDLPGQGPRKLPAPRQYVAIVVLWSMVELVASIGGQAARVANAFAWLVVLAGMTLGPFGTRIVAFLTGVGRLYPVSSQNEPSLTFPNSSQQTGIEA